MGIRDRAKSLAGNISKEISCLKEEYERAYLSIRETNSQMESLQKDVTVLRSELERKENVIGELNERLAGSFENSPTARGQIGKQGVGAQGFGDGDEKASGAARALEKTRRSLAGLADQISAGVDTAVLNKACPVYPADAAEALPRFHLAGCQNNIKPTTN